MNPNSLKNLRKCGNRKGVPNKFTTLKDTFLQAFNELGGSEALQEWAQKDKNRGQFYQMIAKMLPNKVEADIDVSGRVQIVEIPAKLPKGGADDVK